MAGAAQNAPLVAGATTRQSTTKLVFRMLCLASWVFITRVSWVVMKVTDTALLGHSGTRFLEAASLSDLWTQSTGVFIMSRASATLCSQAYGAGNRKLVGVWTQMALAVFAPVVLLVAVAWTF